MAINRYSQDSPIILNKVHPDDFCCIVVLHNPNLSSFRNIFHQFEKNFNKIIIVTNGIVESIGDLVSGNVHIIINQKNQGLAKAINQGISKAKDMDCNMVALFDQDTKINNNFLESMVIDINNYNGNKRIALYSPRYKNSTTGKISQNIYLKLFHFVKKNDDERYSYPYYSITSGSIIPMKIFDKIGVMKEELFMDYIDIEWCLRARNYNYEIISLNKVLVEHSIGERGQKIFGRKFTIHAPERMYYYFRNSIFLYKIKYLDINWKLADFIRNTLRFIFYITFVNKRFMYLKNIIQGYWHGLVGKMGGKESNENREGRNS